MDASTTRANQSTLPGERTATAVVAPNPPPDEPVAAPQPVQAIAVVAQSVPADAIEGAADLKMGEESFAADLSAPAAPMPPAHDGPQGWTFILLSFGFALIACCLLIPQGDENRRLAYEVYRLGQDLEYLQRQVSINDEFLSRIGRDPALAQRLALRQMKLVPRGTAILDQQEWRASSAGDLAPWALVTIPPPPEPAAPELRGGRLAEFCRDGRTRMYLLGSGLMLLAAGMVLGAHRPA